MSTNKSSKFTSVVVYILVVLAVIAAVGLLYSLTNGFTSDVKTFYVVVDKEIVTDEHGGYVVTPNKPLEVKVQNLSANGKGYTVKVVPNEVEGKDFSFMSSSASRTFQTESNLTEGFTITADGNTFTLTPKGNSLTEVLKSICGESVIDCGEFAYKDMFTVVVSSNDESNVVKLNFSVAGGVQGVTLDKEAILF